MNAESKFLNNLFSILDTTETGENKRTIRVELRQDHAIFEGHFPGNPVLPGVCILHILKTLLELSTGRELMLSEAGSIKFITSINPTINPEVDFDIQWKENENGQLNCQAMAYFEAVVFYGFKGLFVECLSA
jgi:3-hydroxyacyl-[acyl-carrier-protein] dehydratase